MTHVATDRVRLQLLTAARVKDCGPNQGSMDKLLPINVALLANECVCSE